MTELSARDRTFARRGSTWRQRERWLGGAISIPLLLPFLVFAIVPIVYVIAISFTDYNGILAPEWIGFSNYLDLLVDSSWWQSVGNTLIIGLGKAVIEIPLALALAVLLNRGRRIDGVFRAIYFIPHVVSIAVMGVVFYFLLRLDDGVINGLLSGLGLFPDGVDWLGHRNTAIASLIAIGVWSGFGINTVFFLVGLQTIPRELYESSSIDGASGWRQFRSITLPLLAPMLRVVVMLTIVFSMRTFDLVKTLTDGGPAGQTNVMFTYLFGYFFSLDRGTQYGYGSALAVAASIIIAIISLLYLYVSRQRDAVAGGGKGHGVAK